MIYLFFVDINELEVMNYIVKRLYPHDDEFTEDPIGPACQIKTDDVVTHYYKCLHDYDSLPGILNKLYTLATTEETDITDIPNNGFSDEQLRTAVKSCIIEEHENTEDVQTLLDAMLIANTKTI